VGGSSMGAAWASGCGALSAGGGVGVVSGAACWAMRGRGAGGAGGFLTGWGAGGVIVRVCSGLTLAVGCVCSWKSRAPDIPSRMDTCTTSTMPASHISVRREGRPVAGLGSVDGRLDAGGMGVGGLSGCASPGRPTVGPRMRAGLWPRGLASRFQAWPMSPWPRRPKPSGHRRRTPGRKSRRCRAARH